MGDTMIGIPDWAIEAADRILDLDAIEMKVEGWNKDATRKRIASIIATHAAPQSAAVMSRRSPGCLRSSSQRRTGKMLAIYRPFG